MAEIRVMATDLDGTIIGGANEFPLYTQFRDTFNDLKRRYDTAWVVCTGRTLASFLDFMSPMRLMGIAPDFAILRHAYIYEKTRYGYLPHIFWNIRIFIMQWASMLYMRETIEEWHSMITSTTIGVSTIKKKRNRLWMRFDTEDSAEVAANILKEKARPHRHLQVFRYLKEVDVRSVPFTKGLAVTELARHLGVPTAQVLTIGNGHNDISMLNDAVAGMTGCPANSEPEVMNIVHKMNGHISRQRSLGGVLDIIAAFLTDHVASELPPNWKDPVLSVNPSQAKSSKRRRHRLSWSQLIMIAGVIYVVLLVPAYFNLIPMVSAFIRLPFDIVVRVLQKILF